MVLEILFWILLLLTIIGCFTPEPWRAHLRYVDLVLFVLLGLRVFGMPH